MKISDTTKRQARNVCRIASVLTVLVTMNACGMIRDAIDGKDGTNTGSSSNGNDTSSKASTTNAQSLAATAQQANDPATQSYVTLCQKNAACKDDADKVSALIQEAIQEISSKKDATATLNSFETALTTLIQCVDKNPPTDGTPAPAAPKQPVQDSNKTCTSSTDPNGTTKTECKSAQQDCMSLEQPDGYTVETCVSKNANSTGNPSNGNSTYPGNGNTTNPGNGNSTGNPGDGNATGYPSDGNAMGNPNSYPTENPNSGANPNQPAGNGTTEQCTATAEADGSMSVTCSCNAKAGTCKVQTTSP